MSERSTRQATSTNGPDITELVRDDAVHSSAYTDARVFELEMDRLFSRAWILIGHVSQISAPGAYVTTRVGREPVLMVRGADDGVRAFYNRCTHRGAKLCMMPKGATRLFTCPYHGWSFDTNGRLVGMPAPDEYPADFQRDKHGLKAVARIEIYRGFVFANLSPGSDSLADFLGYAKSTIDDLVDRAPGDEVFVVGPPLRHRYKGNWKFTFENLNDTLHAGVAHAVAAQAAATVAARLDDPTRHPALGMMLANAKPISSFQALDMVTTPNGHSYFGAHMPTAYRGGVGDEYLMRLAGARGEHRAQEILAVERHVQLLYPSSTWHGRYQTVRLIHPLRVDLTEVVSFVFRLGGAPDEIFDSALTYCNNASSALSSVITDDLEIYEAAQRANRVMEGTWLPISRGQNDTRGKGLGYVRHAATSEAYIRNQYRAWRDALTRPTEDVA